ncbi:MAG: RNA polymerase sigma factor [Myxococcota bacterium]
MSGPVSLEVLYREEVRPLYGFLWRLGARESEMEDLVHDVFVTAARRWASFDQTRPARPWLLGIAFRLFSEARRRERPGAPLPEEEEIDPNPTPDEAVARRQAQRVLRRALDTLPEERRVAFVLHELEGLSVQEVSGLMSAPAPTTYSRLKLAREEVSRAVERFRREEEQRGGAR